MASAERLNVEESEDPLTLKKLRKGNCVRYEWAV